MKTLIVCLIVYWTCATKSVTGSVEGFHSFEGQLNFIFHFIFYTACITRPSLLQHSGTVGQH